MIAWPFFSRIRWRLMDTFPHLFVEATSSLPSRAARLAAERLRQSQDFWLAICGCRVKFIFGVRSGGVFDCWKYTLPRCNPPKEVTDHHPKKRSPLESPRPLKKKLKWPEKISQNLSEKERDEQCKKGMSGYSFWMPLGARRGAPTSHRYFLFFFFFLTQGAFFVARWQCYATDCFGAYFTHVQTCDVTRV